MKNINFNFKNKVVIITGGEGTLGTTLAEAFLGSGATVYTAGRTKNEKLNSEREFVQMDVKSLNSIRAGINYIFKRSKKIDILITAAGIQIRKPALEFKISDYKEASDLADDLYSKMIEILDL